MVFDEKEIAKVLPPLLRFLAGRIAQILGPNYFICAPLLTSSEVHGLLAVSGPRLSQVDRPAIRTLAAQASIALQNASLYEKVQNELAERKQAEAALIESEKRFRGLFNTSPDAILLIDPHHPYISCWVENTILNAIEYLKSDELPAPGPDCDFCKYRNAVRQAVKQLENKLKRGIV